MSNAFRGFLVRLERPAYAALRMVSGAAFSVHGMQKILGWFTERPTADFGSQMWFGGAIELVCGRGDTSVYLSPRFAARVTSFDLWVSPDELAAQLAVDSI